MTTDQEARFWKYVVADPGTGCWLWGGYLFKGYGRFGLLGKKVLAYRTLYEHERGPVPEGMCLDHLCRNRACVNPAHLEVVTNRENILRGDSFAGRQARQTHCVRGHELYGDNLAVYTRPGGVSHRQCRACDSLRAKRRNGTLTSSGEAA